MMPVVELTRRFRFSASHRLHSAELSEAENTRVYGKCNNPYGHGHDYVLDVTVRGAVDAATGTIVALSRLDDYVRRHAVSIYEWRYLNLDVPSFLHTVPTAENIALDAEARLRQCWSREFGEQLRLAGVRLEETKRNTIEIRR